MVGLEECVGRQLTGLSRADVVGAWVLASGGAGSALCCGTEEALPGLRDRVASGEFTWAGDGRRSSSPSSFQFGLGLKTHAVLLENNIESVVVLDSAVSFIMGKVDYCIVGAEAVCESGGLVNYVSSSSSSPEVPS